MTEKKMSDAEQAVQALHDFLKSYFHRRRIPWMHDMLGTEFDQGEAHALTGLVLIPEVRAVLNAIDENLVGNLESWHEKFKKE